MFERFILKMGLRLAISSVLFLEAVGCMSQIQPFKQYADAWVGKPVDILIEAGERKGSYASRSGWQRKKYELKNGVYFLKMKVIVRAFS